MPNKNLKELRGSVRNYLPKDLVIVDPSGNKRQMIPRFVTDESATRVLCSIVCPHYGTMECPRIMDVSDKFFASERGDPAKMSVVRIATLNGKVPIYRWNSKKPQYLYELRACIGGKYVSVKNLPDMKNLRKRLTAKKPLHGEEYEKWAQVNGLPDASAFDTQPVEMPYCVVSYMMAMIMREAHDELDHVLVPVLPYVYGGKLKGFRGLMPAKYLFD